mgnify:CR=1 FL=1
MALKLSLVIPCKDKNDKKLADLLRSIEAQDFPKNEMEVLVITEGTSESAKAIGIRKARGEVIGILASDNVLIKPHFLRWMYMKTLEHFATFPAYYEPIRDSLNRYFALIGGNDPLSFYMGKNDRLPHYKEFHKTSQKGTSLGDNGFFILKRFIEQTDLNNYYHVDNANESACWATPIEISIIHNTGGNIFSFFCKRYLYGLQHAFNPNRRWHLVDFRQPKDIVRLIWFIVASMTIVQPLSLSIRGYLKIRDVAFFLHPVVCILTVFTYAVLVMHLGVRRLFQSLSAPMIAQKA